MKRLQQPAPRKSTDRICSNRQSSRIASYHFSPFRGGGGPTTVSWGSCARGDPRAMLPARAPVAAAVAVGGGRARHKAPARGTGRRGGAVGRGEGRGERGSEEARRCGRCARRGRARLVLAQRREHPARGRRRCSRRARAPSFLPARAPVQLAPKLTRATATARLFRARASSCRSVQR